jgi:hypothetical protein
VDTSGEKSFSVHHSTNYTRAVSTLAEILVYSLALNGLRDEVKSFADHFFLINHREVWCRGMKPSATLEFCNVEWLDIRALAQSSSTRQLFELNCND